MNWWASTSAWAVPLRQGALKDPRTRPPGGGPQVAFAVGDGAYAGKALLERLIMGCDAARLALRVD